MTWMSTDLYLPPRPEWDAEWATATETEFVRRKTDRGRRMHEHQEYVSRWLLDAFHQSPGLVIDIGPGCGELLELARAAGHDILGVDAPEGDGGMGDEYLAACRLMHERQRIPVVYMRLLDWLAQETVIGEFAGRCVAVNFRGSIEQCFSDYMLGEPHHVHQDAKRLAWREDEATAETIDAAMLRLASLLRHGGHLAIAFNGASNSEWASRTFDDAGIAAGLTLKLSDGDRVKVWVK